MGRGVVYFSTSMNLWVEQASVISAEGVEKKKISGAQGVVCVWTWLELRKYKDTFMGQGGHPCLLVAKMCARGLVKLRISIIYTVYLTIN